MDESIRDYLRLRYAVQFGERTIERVKRELGSASADQWDTQLDKEMEGMTPEEREAYIEKVIAEGKKEK